MANNERIPDAPDWYYEGSSSNPMLDGGGVQTETPLIKVKIETKRVVEIEGASDEIQREIEERINNPIRHEETETPTI